MLRPYQREQFQACRIALRTHDNVLLQAPTGTGKTVVVAAITHSATERAKRIWFIVPRRELMDQAKKHFRKWGIPFNTIAPRSSESKAYHVHIVSKDTLIRRWDKIKTWPDLIIIDEAHVNYKFQMDLKKILQRIYEETGLRVKTIGLSATPERLDGLGLSNIYDTLILSHSIPWFSDPGRGFLSPLRYFRPPDIKDGLENLHYRGTEVDADEWELLIEKNKVYGKVIEHYIREGSIKKRTVSTTAGLTHTNGNYNRGRPGIWFTRTVKAAYDLEKQFQDRNYKVFCIEGKMKGSERRRLINALTTGEIDGLTSCEILTYGFDCPRVEYGASLRPTMSRALYFQMVGRILRPYKNYETGYEKEDAIFMDHVNLIGHHYDPEYPGVPLFKLENIEWNFDGTKKRKRLKPLDDKGYCPYINFEYCERKRCDGCPHLPGNAENFKQESEPEEIIDVKLKEIENPIPLAERPPEEKREIVDDINKNISEYVVAAKNGEVLSGPVGELIRIAKQLGRSVMWVYHVIDARMCELKEFEDDGVKKQVKKVNISLLHEIARQLGYKPGWVWYKKNQIMQNRKKEVAGV